MEREQVIFADFQIEVHRRPYRRRLTLSVGPTGAIRLRAAQTTSKRAIDRFLNQCMPWLTKTVTAYQEHRKKNPPKTYQMGERFLFLGEHRTLRFACRSEKKFAFVIRGNELIAYVPDTLWHEGWQTHPQPQLHPQYIHFLKKQARDILQDRLQFLSQKMALYPSSVSFRSQRTRWGSCSAHGHISLNWRLVLAPLNVLDYVVIHELAHLRHPNHSAPFWNLVATYCPDYENCKKWLRENQGEIDAVLLPSEV